MASFVHGRLRLRNADSRFIAASVALIAVTAFGWSLLARPGASTPATPVRAASVTRLGISAGSHESTPLARLAATRPGAAVEVIIQLRAGVGAAAGSRLVRSLGGTPGAYLHIINGLSARMTAGAASRLGRSPSVRAVSLNAALKESYWGGWSPWHLATTFDQSVGATRLWDRTTGRGVGVAVIDTGISGDLPDFRTSQSDTTSRVITSAVIDPNATTATDTYGHGTAVAGLIAGNGTHRDAGDPQWGQYSGSAPDANLISIKIADDTGASTTLDAVYGLQFAVDHQSEDNIRVINLSFRSTSAESYKTDPLDAAVEQAWFHGIVVVAAAGNLGTEPDAVSYAPGNDPYVLTVGAVDDQGTRWQGDDQVASWSSQGTTQDGFAKPDVLAPGAHIVSALAPNSAFTTLCPTCVIGNSYFQLSGTSLASPIVAGVAADLIAAHPDWTPDEVKGAIVNTANQLPSGGHEVNAPAAYWADGGALVSDQGLTPNGDIDPSTGSIDYSQASWSQASWSTAADPLAASWSQASWSCVDCSGSSDGGNVNPTCASWSSLGWATFWG
jgi:serine protease AprX